MSSDLNLEWDEQEHTFIQQYTSQTNKENTVVDVDDYLSFLSEFKPRIEDIVATCSSLKKFTLP